MAQSMIFSNLMSGDVITYYITTPNGSVTYYNNLTIEEINKLIGDQIIQPQYRIFVLHSDETIDYEIPPRDILLSGANYSENYQNGQRRSISFSVLNRQGNYTPDINHFWTGTKVKLEVGLKIRSGETIWFPKGIYSINSANPEETNNEQITNFQCGDKFSILEGNLGTLDSSYEIPVGTDAEEVVKSLLAMDKGNNELLDPVSPIFHSSLHGKKIQSKIQKTMGDKVGSIIDEIATQLSAEYFYNAIGNLVFIPTTYSTLDADKPIIYDLYDFKGDIDAIGFTFDYSTIVNKVIVTGSTTTGGDCKAEAVNNDPGSPTCVQRIGIRVGQVVNDTNINSRILAQERADYELRQQLIIKTSTGLNVPFNPLLEVNNLITITDTFFSMKKEAMFLQSISYNLDFSGTMNISVSNIKNLPFISKELNYIYNKK